MGTISQVTMQGCDANVASGFCPAPKGSMAHGQFTFTPSVDIDSFSCDIGTILAPVHIACPVADGCKSIVNNVTCPIKAGTKVVYNIDIDVLPFYPQVRNKNCFSQYKIVIGNCKFTKLYKLLYC